MGGLANKQTQDQPLQVGMMIFPGFKLQDLAGPQSALGFHGETHLIWKRLEPVRTDMGVEITPTTTFADMPKALDILFVPGGNGTPELMKDREYLDFLERAGRAARYVTAARTGSIILAMAGLLDGYRAATYWPYYEPLITLGIVPSYDRICVDRNRITGGGYTAGIDLALSLIAEIKGLDAAEFTQLALEYEPQPLFTSGHPSGARPEIVEQVSHFLGRTSEAVKVAKAHMEKRAQAA